VRHAGHASALRSAALKHAMEKSQVTRGVAVLGYVPVGDCGLVLLATRVKTVVTLPGGHDVNLVTGSAWASVPLEVCKCPLLTCLLSVRSTVWPASRCPRDTTHGCARRR
jgi:hypothetical protein